MLGYQRISGLIHWYCEVEPSGLVPPASQAVHSPDAGPQKLATHTHAKIAVEFAGLFLLSPHFVQNGVVPLESFHRPAGQCPAPFGIRMGVVQRELVASHT